MSTSQKASEAQAQLLLQEQEQRSALMISELRKALKAITDQDVANTRASAEMEVLLRKELLEAKHRIAQLEPPGKRSSNGISTKLRGGSRFGAASSCASGGATFRAAESTPRK
jgi:hypothetical protein